jgi:probable rRNA maturation factor
MNEPPLALQLHLKPMKSAARIGRKRPAMQRARHPPTIDIRLESPLWKAKRNAKSILRRAIRQASSAVALMGGEVSVVLSDDSTVRVLNRTWRHEDTPTNVLSFPTDSRKADRGRPRLLGDIVIAYQTAKREANTQRKPFAQHLAHLAVHGFLHLVGYDHKSGDEAKAMERLEILILARLNVPNPYNCTGRNRRHLICHA